jgi:hypothetical protein
MGFSFTRLATANQRYLRWPTDKGEIRAKSGAVITPQKKL